MIAAPKEGIDVHTSGQKAANTVSSRPIRASSDGPLRGEDRVSQLSKEDLRARLGVLKRALARIRAADKQFPSQELAVLVSVALEEGQSQVEIQASADIGQSSCSRAVDNLGDAGPGGKRFLDNRRGANRYDARASGLFITTKGNTFLEELVNILGGAQSKHEPKT